MRRLNRIGQMEKSEIEVHDLRHLASMLGLSASLTSEKASAFRLKKSKSSRPIEHAHLAWRYGVAMNKEDEEKLVNWLKKLQQKIRKK